MKYEVLILRSAEKEMDSLPDMVHSRLSRKILSLSENPRPKGTKKLGGREEYRIRVGNYRILYTVDDETGIIKISAVGHRRDVYRQ
jgi:mRNA interferase RelE/StbE